MEGKLMGKAPEGMEDNGRNKGACPKYELVRQIDALIGEGDYKSAFRLFRRRIIGILCEEGILDVCSPYYRRGGRVKEDKVIGEFAGAYEYYFATNRGYRSFRPHGDSFRCGNPTVSFFNAVKEYLKLLAENPDRDPWEVLICIAPFLGMQSLYKPK